MKSLRATVALVSLLLFAASLLLPAATTPSQSFPGHYFLVSGAFGMLTGEFRWLANILMLVGWATAFSAKRPTPFGVGCCAIAFAIGVSCIVYPPNVVTGSGSYITTRSRLAIGGFAWVAAQLAALLANLIRETNSRQDATPAA